MKLTLTNLIKSLSVFGEDWNNNKWYTVQRVKNSKTVIFEIKNTGSCFTSAMIKRLMIDFPEIEFSVSRTLLIFR